MDNKEHPLHLLYDRRENAKICISNKVFVNIFYIFRNIKKQLKNMMQL